jgi:peptidoglycan/xylan/chitin deacetylase (PgdA/CDA1 family)
MSSAPALPAARLQAAHPPGIGPRHAIPWLAIYVATFSMALSVSISRPDLIGWSAWAGSDPLADPDAALVVAPPVRADAATSAPSAVRPGQPADDARRAGTGLRGAGDVRPLAPPPPDLPDPHESVAVPILYYHRVQPLPADFRFWASERADNFIAYDVLPAAFEAHLDWLLANGYTTILPRDLAAYWDSGTPLPPRPVILTFDDGTHDWIRTVLPALRSRGMVAQFYVNVDNVRRGALSWDDVQTLAAAGNGIGAHGVAHVQVAGSPSIRALWTDAEVAYQLTAPRRIMLAELGFAPDSIAYVGGGYDPDVIGIVRAAGYTTARTTLRGRDQRGERRYELRVVRVGVHDDVVNLLRGRLAPGLPTFARLVTGRADGTLSPADGTPTPADGTPSPADGRVSRAP